MRIAKVLLIAAATGSPNGGISFAPARSSLICCRWAVSPRVLSSSVPDDLEAAIGVGQGKHVGKKKKARRNKYARDDGANEDGLDPWDREMQRANQFRERRGGEEEEDREVVRQERRVRGEIEYPDEGEINPYDPSTFGYTEVGYIMGAHGLRGEVKMRCTSDFGELRLCSPGERHLRAPDRRFPRSIQLISGRLQADDMYIVRFAGVADRDQAALLRDHVLYIRDAVSAPPLEEDEFLVSDLIEMKVYLENKPNQYIGKVVGVVVMNDMVGEVAGRFTDLLELELPPRKEGGPLRQCYVPMAPSIVPHISTAERLCRINPPEGLLELAVEKEEKIIIKGLLAPPPPDTVE